MSDFLKHECGIAMIRLLKPLSYFQEKYDTPLYGFNQLFLLMEKQHNRGQDGAGIGCVKLGVAPGAPYMARERTIKSNSLSRIFKGQLKAYQKMVDQGIIHPEFPETVKDNFGFGGEILLGHLRYGTSGVYSSTSCHPYVRESNWPTKNLMLAMRDAAMPRHGPPHPPWPCQPPHNPPSHKGVRSEQCKLLRKHSRIQSRAGTKPPRSHAAATQRHSVRSKSVRL